MVVAGRALFGDRLTPLQRAAVGFAALGIAFSLLLTQSAGWPTLLVAALYPVYFCLRRKTGLDTLTVFLMEIALLMVPSVVFIAIGVTSRVAGSGADATYGPLFAMAALSGVAMVLYLLASRWLPLGLFGMLSYLEPVLILVAAVLLGESLTLEDGLVYGPIVIALALMTLSMLRRRGDPASR